VTAAQQALTFDARVSDPSTSHGAAEENRPRRSKHRQLVLDALVRAGQHGLTDFELGAIVGLQPTSCGKRRLDLQRDGLVEPTGDRRPSPTGTPALVWRASVEGWRAWWETQ
jgi:hypothetical protein